MLTEITPVVRQQGLGHDYYLLTLHAPEIARTVQPGQFVHLRVPGMESGILRRPFSVFKAEHDELTLLYRVIGQGTNAMRRLQPGEEVNLLGPLGHGFPPIEQDKFPVLIAGGYGAAALYLAAARAARRGMICMGASTATDILCSRDFQDLDWEVRLATEDGTAGTRGLVTEVLDQWLAQRPENCIPEFLACGPNGMLRAVSRRAQAGGWRAWVSLDRHMGCGMGACLACVQKVRKPKPDGSEEWQWVRLCTEGPVFESRDIIWDEND
ncbi:MAG: dihydroorotate dehydrogenase electron transfer subunit [Kiritimatiellia bacterium]|nr:dihydroorotate dehydrogenase electron transfer subunit [Lentisphaerota bacterium]